MAAKGGDIFINGDGTSRLLRGMSITSGSTRLAELAGCVGFDSVWIEMEHGPVDFNQVESLCVAAEAGGAVPAVRVPDGQRHHILRALEVGARIVIVPMINDAEQARLVVQHGKFPPMGSRGFNLRSRGLGYGLNGGCVSTFAEANESTHLFAQVETREAVENLDEICLVEGLSGVIIGPGDLSSSFGRPGEFDNPQLIRIVADCIHRAKAAGRRAGVFAGPGKLLDAALAAGCDLAYLATDTACLAVSWTQLLASLKVAAPTR